MLLSYRRILPARPPLMNIVTALVAFMLSLLFGSVGVARVNAWLTERRNPPVGAFVEVDGARLHVVHIPAWAWRRPAADRLHPWRQRQSKGSDGAAAAAA